MNKQSLILTSVVLLGIFLFSFYLFQIGSLVEQSYLTKGYKAELEELSRNAVISYDGVINLDSLSRVEQEIKAFNFVRTNEITYIPLYSDILVKGN